MSAAATDLPSISTLTAEQKARLLALLIKDELDRQPIPMPMVVRLDGKELGQFRPNVAPPGKTTPPPFPTGYVEDLEQSLQNPERRFTSQELLDRTRAGGAETPAR
ncbi:MAG TPA: hypothetical protein VKE40_01040 [Gemmataceae bacterium]|nr:hypothetical protein [Gemmataceae bacterium]